MLREAIIAYVILLLCCIFLIGCTFYVRSYHDDKPLNVCKKEVKNENFKRTF